MKSNMYLAMEKRSVNYVRLDVEGKHVIVFKSAGISQLPLCSIGRQISILLSCVTVLSEASVSFFS